MNKRFADRYAAAKKRGVDFGLSALVDVSYIRDLAATAGGDENDAIEHFLLLAEGALLPVVAPDGRWMVGLFTKKPGCPIEKSEAEIDEGMVADLRKSAERAFS